MSEKIYSVISGPYHSSEVPDWDIDDDGWGLPYGEGWMLVVQMDDERGVGISVEELIFENLDDALEIVNWFKSQIVPYDWEEIQNG